MVDEAIYSMQPEQTPRHSQGVLRAPLQPGADHASRSRTTSPATPATSRCNSRANKPAYQLADFKNEGQYAEPTIRKDFKDTAFWQPDVVTGADGKATVEVKLPDNLTTWRATARAVTADTRVGSAVVQRSSRART